MAHPFLRVIAHPPSGSGAPLESPQGPKPLLREGSGSSAGIPALALDRRIIVTESDIDAAIDVLRSFRTAAKVASTGSHCLARARLRIAQRSGTARSGADPSHRPSSDRLVSTEEEDASHPAASGSALLLRSHSAPDGLRVREQAVVSPPELPVPAGPAQERGTSSTARSTWDVIENGSDDAAGGVEVAATLLPVGSAAGDSSVQHGEPRIVGAAECEAEPAGPIAGV